MENINKRYLLMILINIYQFHHLSANTDWSVCPTPNGSSRHVT